MSEHIFIGSRQVTAPASLWTAKPVIRSRIIDGKRQWLCGFKQAYVSQMVKDGYVVVASAPERAYQAWCNGGSLAHW